MKKLFSLLSVCILVAACQPDQTQSEPALPATHLELMDSQGGTISVIYHPGSENILTSIPAYTEMALQLEPSVVTVEKVRLKFNEDKKFYYLVFWVTNQAGSMYPIGGVLNEVSASPTEIGTMKLDTSCSHFCAANVGAHHCDLVIYDPCRQATCKCLDDCDGGTCNIGIRT
ncbi:hypothetical protein [Pontibacter sp. G13]|uniref:hypothetical protein n=1 Tax=Pontibacter sp. G13 TaxID=3074898 RepID=UPI0028890525|nr:hypothetical protein [Pontibacter sp. G13]WNJ21092.1 hypothetical protein RJD25_11535 [Pontibacter sp. G13]